MSRAETSWVNQPLSRQYDLLENVLRFFYDVAPKPEGWTPSIALSKSDKSFICESIYHVHRCGDGY